MQQAFLTFILIIIIAFSTNAQKLKKKTESNGNYKEIYFVDKETKFKQGTYTKINTKTKTEIVSGAFKNEMRTGVWTFRDAKTKQVQLEYDFTNDSLTFIDLEQYPDSFLVMKEGAFVYDKVDRPLIFIGYKNEEKHILALQIKIPKAIMDIGDGGTSILQFIVNEQGEMIGSKIISSYNAEIEQQINSIISSFYGRFLPAVVDGEPVKSAFYVKTLISPVEPEQFVLNNKPFICNLTIVYKSTTYVRKETHTITKTSTTRIPRR